MTTGNGNITTTKIIIIGIGIVIRMIIIIAIWSKKYQKSSPRTRQSPIHMRYDIRIILILSFSLGHCFKITRVHEHDYNISIA